jgi:mannose-6-phosphate isomerase
MSSDKSGIYKLKGVIRDYDWGGTNFLSDFLSYPNPLKKPMAEYWLGAHESAPSVIESSNGDIELTRFIASGKESILGKTVAKKFGRLPYLLKVLDVKDMLSIQVHPSKHAAEVEFAKENAEGIPLNAPHRNYRDDNHKPELVVSLNSFWLIHGFKPANKLRTILKSIPELNPLLSIFDETGYDQLYKTVMEMPQESVNDMLQPLLDRIIPLYQQNKLAKDQEDFWAARAALTFIGRPTDRGIFSIYFFNLIHLEKGEGIFQDAGVPHAYLEGQNVEIMSNSDNVLRGGLTTKHIDVKELMKNTKFAETFPDILHATKINHEELYRTAAPDFKLSHFQLKKDESVTFESVSAEVLLITDGKLLINSETSQLELLRGEATFIKSHQHIDIKALSASELYRASVPAHSNE